MSAFRSALIAIGLLASATAVGASSSGTFMPGPVHIAEGRSRALCESDPNRIFVVAADGSECVAYAVTEGNEDRDQAVFFFGGDAAAQSDAAAFDRYMEGVKKGNFARMQQLSARYHVRFVYIFRLGVHGSSGDARLRRTPHETLIMKALIPLLSHRLNVKTFAVAGQSGGSTLGGAFLTMRVPNIVCAILGSGAYDLVGLLSQSRIDQGFAPKRDQLARTMYDPLSHVSEVLPVPGRRIFVFGDRDDPRASFPQQVKFVAGLQAGGNNAMLIPVSAIEHHGAAAYTLSAAGACLDNYSDVAIAKIVDGMETQPESLQCPEGGDQRRHPDVIGAMRSGATRRLNARRMTAADVVSTGITLAPARRPRPR